jgi:hypothetical protein
MAVADRLRAEVGELITLAATATAGSRAVGRPDRHDLGM